MWWEYVLYWWQKVKLSVSVLKRCSVKMYEGVEIKLHAIRTLALREMSDILHIPTLSPMDQWWTWYQNRTRSCSWNVSSWKPSSTMWTERCGRVVGTPALYSGGLGCRIQPRDWLYWLRVEIQYTHSVTVLELSLAFVWKWLRLTEKCTGHKTFVPFFS
jgi:hypothetical protein